jgi:flagellin
MGTLSFLGLGNSYALTYSISGTTEDYAISASRKAFSAISSAIDDVTRQRGIVGASASRLSSALSYLAVARENTQAAESNLRDSDVAADTAELVRLQVLQQAQISLIAQANQEPTLALKLLT